MRYTPAMKSQLIGCSSFFALFSALGGSLLGVMTPTFAAEPLFATNTIRVAATQPRARFVDWHLKQPAEVLARVEQSLTELEGLLAQAAARNCDVIAFPEDTLGLGRWEAGNEALLREVLAVVSEVAERCAQQDWTAGERQRPCVRPERRTGVAIP